MTLDSVTRTVQDYAVVDALGRSGKYTGQVCHGEGGLKVPQGDGRMQYDAVDSDQTTMVRMATYHGPWQQGHFEGDRGEAKYSNGDTYVGQWQQSQQHGRGHYVWHDDRKEYTGDYRHNLRHGHGQYVWHHGDRPATYEGAFVQNQRQGIGTYRDEHVKYEGSWLNGQYHGYGVYEWKDATTSAMVYRYRGNFARGQPHGQGTQIQPNGDVYHDGMWDHGKPLDKKMTTATAAVVAATGAPSPSSRPTTVHQAQPSNNTMVVQHQRWKDPVTQQHATYRGLWNVIAACPTGTGTLTFDVHVGGDARSIELAGYEGCFDEHGRLHGTGRLLFANGDAYTGNFAQHHRHGHGTYGWPDGRQYRGQFVHNVRHGHGTFLYPNGDWYEGDFASGQRHGVGKFVFGDGSVYEGGWQHGRYHGHGMLVQSNGQTYTGAFVNGLYHGTGREVSVNGKVLYEGEYVQGRRATDVVAAPACAPVSSQRSQFGHAVDVAETASLLNTSTEDQDDDMDPKTPAKARQLAAMTSPTSVLMSSSSSSPTPTSQQAADACAAVVDAAVVDAQGNAGRYTGLVLSSSSSSSRSTLVPHGVGRLVYNDGKRIHEGFWQHGSKHGHGRCLFFPQGDFHEGEYVHNFRTGQGKYFWQDGRTYVGGYHNDMRQGHGVFNYPNGDRYEGNFERGMRSGTGKFLFQQGTGLYDGEWKNGKYHGYGKLRWEDGKTYEGTFEEGCYHGHGVKKDANSVVVYDGQWVQGRTVTPLTTTATSGATDDRKTLLQQTASIDEGDDMEANTVVETREQVNVSLLQDDSSCEGEAVNDQAADDTQSRSAVLDEDSVRVNSTSIEVVKKESKLADCEGSLVSEFEAVQLTGPTDAVLID